MPILKYVRLNRFDEIIIFPETLQHSTFKHLNIISAGFCRIKTENETVECFGESISLNKTSKEEDSEIATNQLFKYY